MPRVCFVPLLLSVVIASSVRADEREMTSLDAVLVRALDESPSVKAIAAKEATARAEGIALSTLPNPELSSELRFPTENKNDPDHEADISLSQPLRLSHFGARDRVNELIVEASTTDQKIELLKFIQTLRLAYIKRWTLQTRLEQLRAAREKITKLERLVEEGMTKGLYTAGEERVFRAESLKLVNEEIGVKADLARAEAELTRQAGFIVEQRLERPQFPSLDALNLESTSIPAQKRAELALKLAREQARLARLDAYPQFAPRLVYEHTAEGDDFIGVGLTVELPFFDRNQGARLERESESRAAESLAHSLEGERFTSELRSLTGMLAASVKQARHYETEVVPAVRGALAAEEKRLNAGQGALFSVWQTFRELNESEAHVLELWVKVFATRAELTAILGRDL